MTLKRIPLYDVHRELGASFGEFAGWETVINYGSVVEEHMAVRSRAGFFDLSHMGRLVLRGNKVAGLLDRLVPRRIDSEAGQMVGPTAFLNEKAGFVDDVMLYNMGSEWMVVPNAANIEKDKAWIESWARRLGFDVEVDDKTMEWVLFAVQGPESVKLMKELGAPKHVLELRLLRFARDVVFENASAKAVLVSRSGWTGEDGFEIIAVASEGEKILRKAAEIGATLCGLAARDSLRMEVGFVLYGDEIDENTTPIEARYWWVFQPGPKEECIGCRALRDAMRKGASRVRVAVKLGKGKGARIVPRKGDRIVVEGEAVGVVTSGAYSPVLKRGIGQAYVAASHALIGMPVEIEHRGRLFKAKILDFPLVQPSSRPPV